MIAVTRTITVRQNVETVHEYLKDFGHARYWDPGTVICERVDDGPIRVGAQWTNTSRFMGRTAVLNYRLETLEPDHLVFRGSNDSSTSSDDLTLRAHASGSEITYRAEIRFDSSLLRLVAPLLQRPFERLADRVAAQMTETINAL